MDKISKDFTILYLICGKIKARVPTTEQTCSHKSHFIASRGIALLELYHSPSMRCVLSVPHARSQREMTSHNEADDEHTQNRLG